MVEIKAYLFIFDIAAVAIMLLLSYLSRRLGEALKIPPYYRLLYLTCCLVFAAFALETLYHNGAEPVLLTMAMRCLAGLVALVVGMRYWGWLFGESFKK